MGAENRAATPYDLPANPELEDLLRVVARQVKLTIRTHVPAVVKTYNPATQRATVIVQQLQVVKVTDPAKVPTKAFGPLKGVPPNAEVPLAPIELPNIKVYTPRTAAGYFTLPIAPGDAGELHVSDRSLEAWMLKGVPTDPVLAFTHALKDSVFYPGTHPDTNPIVPPTDAAAAVIEAAQVKLGRTATLSVALAEPLLAALDALANTAPVAQDGGAAIQAAFKLIWGPPGNARDLFVAQKAKAE